MISTVHFNTCQDMELVLGSNDRNLPYLEILLSTELSVRGNQLTANGNGEVVRAYFDHLMKQLPKRKDEYSEAELYMEFQALSEPRLANVGESGEHDQIITVSGRSIYPKSTKQREYIKHLYEDQITFAIGPAGTGKTFLAIAYALEALLSGRKQKLIITRPVVEAGESLGFLPGDLSQKLNPYLKPIYDAMEYMLTPAQIRKLEENGSIEIAPLAYMRGRSLNRAIVILDESQNTTKGQMKMFLTRIGEDSQAIVTGDPSQVDLPRNTPSGLLNALDILHDIPSLSVVEFRSADIIRSRIVRMIIAAYEDQEERNGL